jgi:hypothetical protein
MARLIPRTEFSENFAIFNLLGSESSPITLGTEYTSGSTSDGVDLFGYKYIVLYVYCSAINSAFSEITSTEDQISAVTKFNSAFIEIVWAEKMVNRPIKTYTGGSIYPSNFTNDNLFKAQFTGYSPNED